jgi:DNA (cytosine-5)-methyltransferase 1
VTRVLDLCCCTGGAAAGYMQAGAEVVGYDLEKKYAKYYPGEFHVGNALEVLRDVDYVRTFDLVHVSFPCQFYTRGNASRRGKPSKWPRLIPEGRELLRTASVPYVIENVTDAAWDMIEPTRLCGCMFDLSTIDTDGLRIHLQRPRLFETSFPLTAPRECEGKGQPRWKHPSQEWVAGAYGGARRDKYEAKYERHGGYVPRDKAVVAALLGFEHETTWEGLFESIPPAYTEHVANQFGLTHLANRKD